MLTKLSVCLSVYVMHTYSAILSWNPPSKLHATLAQCMTLALLGFSSVLVLCCINVVLFSSTHHILYTYVELTRCLMWLELLVINFWRNLSQQNLTVPIQCWLSPRITVHFSFWHVMVRSSMYFLVLLVWFIHLMLFNMTFLCFPSTYFVISLSSTISYFAFTVISIILWCDVM